MPEALKTLAEGQNLRVTFHDFTQEKLPCAIRSLPSIQIWEGSKLLRTLSGSQVHTDSVKALLADVQVAPVLDSREEARKQLQLQIDQLATMTNKGSLSTLKATLKSFGALVEHQMRAGTATQEDIRLMSTANLWIAYKSKSTEVAAKEALKPFFKGEHQKAFELMLQSYANELTALSPAEHQAETEWEAISHRPIRFILTDMMTSLGPMNSAVLEARGKLSVLLDRKQSTPLYNKKLHPRRGGLARRMLNGKWKWEGPHWSIKNKNTIRTNHHGSLFERVGSPQPQ